MKSNLLLVICQLNNIKVIFTPQTLYSHIFCCILFSEVIILVVICYDRERHLPAGMSIYTRPTFFGKRVIDTGKIKYLRIPPNVSLNSFWRKVNGTPTGEYIDSWMIEPLLEADKIPYDAVVLFFGCVYTNGLEYFVEAVRRNGSTSETFFVSIQNPVPQGAVAGFICGNCFSGSA